MLCQSNLRQIAYIALFSKNNFKWNVCVQNYILFTIGPFFVQLPFGRERAKTDRHRQLHTWIHQGNFQGPPILVGPPFSYYSHKNPLKSGNGREAYWEGGPGPLGVTGEIPPELVKDFSISMSSSEILTIQPEAGYCSLIWNPSMDPDNG